MCVLGHWPLFSYSAPNAQADAQALSPTGVAGTKTIPGVTELFYYPLGMDGILEGNGPCPGHAMVLSPPPPAPPPDSPPPAPVAAVCMDGRWPLFATGAEAVAANDPNLFNPNSNQRYYEFYPNGWPNPPIWYQSWEIHGRQSGGPCPEHSIILPPPAAPSPPPPGPPPHPPPPPDMPNQPKRPPSIPPSPADPPPTPPPPPVSPPPQHGVYVIDLENHPDTKDYFCGEYDSNQPYGQYGNFFEPDRTKPVRYVLAGDENEHHYTYEWNGPAYVYPKTPLLYVKMEIGFGKSGLCRPFPHNDEWSDPPELLWWLRLESTTDHVMQIDQSVAPITATFEIVEDTHYDVANPTRRQYGVKMTSADGSDTCAVYHRKSDETNIRGVINQYPSAPVLTPDGTAKYISCIPYLPPSAPPSPAIPPVPLAPPGAPPPPFFPFDIGICWQGNWPMFHTRVEAVAHSPGCADYLCTGSNYNYCGDLALYDKFQPDSNYDFLPNCFDRMEYFDPTATPTGGGFVDSGQPGAWVNKFFPVITDGSLVVTRCKQGCFQQNPNDYTDMDNQVPDGFWTKSNMAEECLRDLGGGVEGTGYSSDPLIPCPGCIEGSERFSPITPPPSPPPITPPPPLPTPPPPSPPPLPPAGTVSRSDIVADGGYASCAHTHLLTMADNTGTAQYGLLYAYYSGGNCVTGSDIASAVGSVPGGWALATLNSAGDPAPGDAQVTAKLEHVPHGGVSYVTVQKSTGTGPKCLAYYANNDAGAMTAYDEINAVWPAFLPDGTREASVNCVAQAPSTPPPPNIPSPPFSPPLRCGPMGSRYPGWRPDDNGGAEYMRKTYIGNGNYDQTRADGVNQFSGMPLKLADATTGLELFDHHPSYPKQHLNAHTVGSNGAYTNDGIPEARVVQSSQDEWKSILNNAWMQNEFPAGITPSGNNADGVPYDFDCAKECTMHYEMFGSIDDPNKQWYDSRLRSYKDLPNPRFNDNIPFFTVRSPGSGLIEQKRLKYDNIDMCRACRQKCCQRACCDGDDDDSWTWGCDVFRQKTNPAAPTAMADANGDGYPDALFSAPGVHNGIKAPLENFPEDWSGQRRDAADPYWYGLETGGIEESYGGGDSYQDFGNVQYYLWQSNPNMAYTKWRNNALYDPISLGFQGNDQPWDNECEVATELQCDYVPPASNRMIQTRLLFSGTVETFPVGQLQTNFAYAVDVPVQDVEVYVQPGSVSANIRVAASENNLVFVRNRMVAVTANVSHASAKIGFPVEKIVEAPNVQEESPHAPPPPPGNPPPPPRNPQPPTSPPPPPSSTVHNWTVHVRGNPAQIDKDAFIGAASLALRISALSINATVTAYAPGISRVNASVHSARPVMPRLIESRYGTVFMANETMKTVGLYAEHPCALDGSDDICSPFDGADWSSAMSSYHFYLYDETPDGVDLRLWEWPRVTPQDDQLAYNGVCEDGHPARDPSIPQGDYYVAFGGPNCATQHVNLTTGLISGCGRVDLVPCVAGTDCADCGRSASLGLPTEEATEAARQRRRRAQQLPAVHDRGEMHHLNRTLATATSYHLPPAWLKALRIKDHFGP